MESPRDTADELRARLAGSATAARTRALLAKSSSPDHVCRDHCGTAPSQAPAGSGLAYWAPKVLEIARPAAALLGALVHPRGAARGGTRGSRGLAALVHASTVNPGHACGGAGGNRPLPTPTPALCSGLAAACAGQRPPGMMLESLSIGCTSPVAPRPLPTKSAVTPGPLEAARGAGRPFTRSCRDRRAGRAVEALAHRAPTAAWARPGVIVQNFRPNPARHGRAAPPLEYYLWNDRGRPVPARPRASPPDPPTHEDLRALWSGARRPGRFCRHAAHVHPRLPGRTLSGAPSDRGGRHDPGPAPVYP